MVKTIYSGSCQCLGVLLVVLCLGLETKTKADVQINQLNPAQLWQKVEFQITGVPTGFNPFDQASIRVDANLTLPTNGNMTVPAFWYQDYLRSTNSNGGEVDAASGSPQWRVRFTPPVAGIYAVSISVLTNGQNCATSGVTSFTVTATNLPGRYGYAVVATNGMYFQTQDGRALPLNGHNVCWSGSGTFSNANPGTYMYDSYFPKMQNASENYTRLWMWPFNFALEQTVGSLTNYTLASAWQLDYVLQLAEQEGIYVQLCLDYHGMFQTVPDSYGGNNMWTNNPYNSLNGGPCVNQNAFFTNAVAQALYQNRLRYLIARYGYSQNLLSLEFLNEIDHEYSYCDSNAVATWHSVMAEWVHANDPYHHLVTSSASSPSAASPLFGVTQLDYLSWHQYLKGTTNPAITLASQAAAFRQAYGKPVQLGECNTSASGWDTSKDPYLRGFRQGLWGGALGGSVGTGMSWWWAKIDASNAYSFYSPVSKILGTNGNGLGYGSWTNVVLGTGSKVSTSSVIGLTGGGQILLYVIATNGIWPTGANTKTLAVQSGASMTLSNCLPGTFQANWYSPTNGALVGSSQIVTTNGNLTLTLPNFTEDLAGVILLLPTGMVSGDASICNGSVLMSIIQDFEGFADSAALNAAITYPTANATVTLGATNGVNGSKALIFQGANGSSPYYSQFTLPVTNFSLAGVQSVTLAMKFISGSSENLTIELLDAGGTTIVQGPQVATASISNASFATYTIGVTNLSSTVAGIRFSYGGNDYGTTTVAFDNISLLINQASATIQTILGGSAGPWIVTWSDGVTQTNNSSPATRSVSPTTTTTYTATIQDTVTSITNSASGSATVTVNVIPVTPTAGNSGPVCAGSALSLNTPAVPGAIYTWTGPNSFLSTNQNPTVSSSATVGMSGNYYVTVTVNGCTSAAGSTLVTVNPTAVGGVTSPASAQVYSGNATNITLSGQTGTIVKWQSSTNGGTNWSDIASTANPLLTGNLTQTTIFRAVVQSGDLIGPL